MQCGQIQLARVNQQLAGYLQRLQAAVGIINGR
jgi:hypothetical protein